MKKFVYNLKSGFQRLLFSSDGFGSKFFDPGRVGPTFWVPFMVWVWKISPKNSIFQFFLLGSGQKVPWSMVGLASYLLRVKSKLR